MADTSDATAVTSTSGPDLADGGTAMKIGEATTLETASRSRSPSSSISQPSTSVLPLRKQLSIGRLPHATTASAGSSRNVSPKRKDGKANGPTSTTTTTPSHPSAAAIQRALSASNVPQLATSAPKDATPRLSRAAQLGAEEAPHWPVSPRLKSPPPSSIKRTPAAANSVKKIDSSGGGGGGGSGSDITTTTATTPVAANQLVQSPRQLSAEAKNDQSLQTPAKNASRGPSGKSMLATVDENSSDAAEPSHAKLQAIADLKPLTKLSDDDKTTDPIKMAESGSESGGDKSDGRGSRRASLSQQAPRRAKNSFTSLPGSKTRQGESGNMTVETETVQSIPHSGIGERNSSNRETALRVKSSTETIRPKKERRPASRKPRSVTGNASTKADIFEARVASAVGEANSSDSDETFVYESNPPEPRRPRHHSRTPSVTSAHSTADQRGAVRNIGEVVDERKVAGKRSMKFSNNPFNNGDSPIERQDGTVRSHTRHYGRLGGRGGSHASVYEPDSPFTAASKLRNNTSSLRHSRPNSIRSAHNNSPRGIAPPVFGKKRDSPFDFEAEGDDERTPLMTRGDRASRLLRHRLDDSESGSIDEYYGVRRRARCGSFGGCFLGVLVFVLIVMSTIGFLVVSNRPLSDVHIRRIEDVLAGEEELMLDLSVGALNPNALSINIAELDVNIFAKSKHVRLNVPDKELAERNEVDSSGLDDLLPPGPKKGKGDDGDEEDSDSTLWLLGQALKFDQKLVFEGSPFQSKIRYSLGELRLAHPGNKTETGSTRWRQILGHPFDLVVRGILKYKLPVSAREETVTVGASVLVHPEDGVDSMGRMRLEPIDHSEHWQWIDWDREQEMLEGIEAGVRAYE